MSQKYQAYLQESDGSETPYGEYTRDELRQKAQKYSYDLCINEQNKTAHLSLRKSS